MESGHAANSEFIVLIDCGLLLPKMALEKVFIN